VTEGDTRLPSTDMIRKHGGELVAYVRSNFPMRFYAGEQWWSTFAAASVLRMADTVDHIITELGTMSNGDSLTLVRVVYEQGVTLCWVAIDPESHHGRWRAHALASDSKLRADIERFGAKLDPIPEPDKSAVGLPSMDQRAEESDQHWHGKVAGLHAGTHLFSFRGLYAALYRTASRPAHASYGAVAEYVDDGARPVVVRSPTASEPGLAVLAVPLLGMTLAVLASRVQWINEDSVREIVGRLHVPG
jgi:hypothetical protein